MPIGLKQSFVVLLVAKNILSNIIHYATVYNENKDLNFKHVIGYIFGIWPMIDY